MHSYIYPHKTLVLYLKGSIQHLYCFWYMYIPMNESHIYTVCRIDLSCLYSAPYYIHLFISLTIPFYNLHYKSNDKNICSNYIQYITLNYVCYTIFPRNSLQSGIWLSKGVLAFLSFISFHNIVTFQDVYLTDGLSNT